MDLNKMLTNSEHGLSQLQQLVYKGKKDVILL